MTMKATRAVTRVTVMGQTARAGYISQRSHASVAEDDPRPTVPAG